MNSNQADSRRTCIESGTTSLGIELGSTRIKAVLIDDWFQVVAQADYGWENTLVDGFWSYNLEDGWKGVQSAYRELAASVQSEYGIPLKKIGTIGISAMMHGYLPFDSEGNQLTAFRTWRNTNTEAARSKLSELFDFAIPHRWSIAHLYQNVLEKADHLPDLSFLTTLAGYVHWKLSGEKVIGIGDAAGIFPVDPVTLDYDQKKIDLFEALPEVKALGLKLKSIFPEALVAGQPAGSLTEEGAKLLDPSGTLEPGARMCPPEGDAGTGMAATNSVSPRTGNVSAGTSIFAMIVLEQRLKKRHDEIDIVATPDGKEVAMVHCNNGTSELDSWVGMFSEFAAGMNLKLSKSQIYHFLYNLALTGNKDGGGLMAYNFLAGEPIAKISEGRPVFLRRPSGQLNLANFILVQLYSVMAILRIGMDILTEDEQVRIDSLLGHGGLFKTEGVAQSIMASALKVPVSVRAQAGEGGAWGAAILAFFLNLAGEMSLADFLDEEVFGGSADLRELQPDPEMSWGFDQFLENYQKALKVADLAASQF